MRVDKIGDRVIAIDPRRIIQIGSVGVLVALAKTHQGLVRPGILIINRDFDDAGDEAFPGMLGRAFQRLQLGHHVAGGGYGPGQT